MSYSASKRRIENLSANGGDSYSRMQAQRIAEFRKQARFSYAFQGVTHCFATLELVWKHREELSVPKDVPIWDAELQKTVS